MATSEQSKYHQCEEKDEDFLENGESDPEYDSDDSMKDPSYSSTLEETHANFSKLSIKRKSKARIVKDIDLGSEADLDGQEVVLPELDEKDEKSFEMVQKIIEARQIDKLKVEQCKLYLRKNGLRLTGNKDTLINRIKEHLEILNGGGEKKYPASSFVLNCKGDACTGDVVMFGQNVYEMFDIASRSGRGPPCGTRIVAGRIVKESYGAAKQQHTFTIEVLWSKGEKPLPPLHPLLIKGRNLYRLKTLRQRWEDEGVRQKVLMEKHSRGSLARTAKEARVQEKEMKKMLKRNRVSRKEEPKKNHSRFNSTSVLKTSVQPQQSGSLVNSANLHQLVGISVDSGNLKVRAQQLGLFTDLSRDPSSKPATQTHQSGFVVYSQNPATQPPAPKSGFFVDTGKVTIQPQLTKNTTMQSANLHQLVGISVDSGNTKVRAQQLGLFTDLSRDPSSKPATQTHQSGFVVYSKNPATQPPAPKSGFFVDSRKVTIQPTIMQDRYFNQASQKLDESRNSNNTERVYNKRQPLTSVNHFLPTRPRGQKQMCQYYAQGRCYYGDNCKFSHEMRGNYNERREERWPHEQRNLCHYGDSSKFSHEMRGNYNERREERWPHEQRNLCHYGDSSKFSHEMRGNYNERREERWPHEQRNLRHYGDSSKFSYGMRENYNERREERWPHEQRNLRHYGDSSKFSYGMRENYSQRSEERWSLEQRRF